jgi:hypothetical protein
MSVTISMAARMVILLFRQLLVINATRSPRVQEKPLTTVSNMLFELIDEPNMRQEALGAGLRGNKSHAKPQEYRQLHGDLPPWSTPLLNREALIDVTTATLRVTCPLLLRHRTE